ncbi:Rare lipoprotein A (modular protein) [Magnetospirillum sp. LM-5]|uniref:septal ring lytic transglycosylase RlpA family protein n=1 Tax=Magnetospirillum sp. LM-5 TaxID=2681466 RepID=UPI001380D3E5|nr:septal ring lytic transglycosylase RlpA family protein [Magnetospirillum sp. LM-5]CAA7615651.1 Rare lipoprotein A (modular protein) [Magnetospirillum sp. LM-5]
MPFRSKLLVALFLVLAATADTARAFEPQPVEASWYGPRYQGKPTASGERFDRHALTAAHPTLPFGTIVEVRRWNDTRRVVVRINDRGPHDGRAIDLSEAAARQLGMIGHGPAWVTLHPQGQVAWR